ncbi:unnamed protein product [Diplocarpon coronariae]|uniref:2EXR domain-containing protein n=1 Tax=Diplocarpon coronariae TaxID=2795749 RepID=A0A218Z9E6_9HELO|nr:hypothetical protein B2J93_382 [Marssonina coronariae]
MTTISADSTLTFEQWVDELLVKELFGPRRDQWDNLEAGDESILKSQSFLEEARKYKLEFKKFMDRKKTDPAWNQFNPDTWMALPKECGAAKTQDEICGLGDFVIQWPLAVDCNAATSPFPHFKLLPLELRRLIWKWALPPARLVRLDLTVEPNRFHHRDYYDDNDDFFGRNMMVCKESWDVFDRAYRPIQVFPGTFEEALERQKEIEILRAEATAAMAENGRYPDIEEEYSAEANGLTVVQRFDYQQDTLALSLSSIQKVAESLNYLDLSLVRKLALAGVHVQPEGEGFEVHQIWKSLHNRCPALKACTALIGERDLQYSFGWPNAEGTDRYCFLEVGAELSEIGRIAITSAEDNVMRGSIIKLSDRRRDIETSFAQEPLMPKALLIQVALLCRERPADSVWLTKRVEIAPKESLPFVASFYTNVPVHEYPVKRLVLNLDGGPIEWSFPCAKDSGTLGSIYDGMSILFEDFDRLSLENEADGILEFMEFSGPGPLIPGDHLLTGRAVDLSS